MEKATGFLLIFGVIYLVLGLAFAIYFLAKGINAIDEGAHQSPVSFKLIIAPGVIVFWVILLRKIMKQNS